MKILVVFFFLIVSTSALASTVITCNDAMSVGGEARRVLHKQAQQRAQHEIESFMEKALMKPYVDVFGLQSSADVMADLIEVYWCETTNTPLHSAYYRFYSSNKNVFIK